MLKINMLMFRSEAAFFIYISFGIFVFYVWFGAGLGVERILMSVRKSDKSNTII